MVQCNGGWCTSLSISVTDDAFQLWGGLRGRWRLASKLFNRSIVNNSS